MIHAEEGRRENEKIGEKGAPVPLPRDPPPAAGLPLPHSPLPAAVRDPAGQSPGGDGGGGDLSVRVRWWRLAPAMSARGLTARQRRGAAGRESMMTALARPPRIGGAPAGAADEGITNGPSTFAYLAFRSRRDAVEGVSKPTKMIVWCGPRT
jgi:hypothetical protein